MNPCGAKLKPYPKTATTGKISQGESEKMHGDEWKHRNTVTVKQFWGVLRWLSSWSSMLPRLTNWLWFPEIPWWKEKTNALFWSLWAPAHSSAHKLTHRHIDISFLNDDLWPFNNPLVVDWNTEEWLRELMSHSEKCWVCLASLNHPKFFRNKQDAPKGTSLSALVITSWISSSLPQIFGFLEKINS